MQSVSLHQTGTVQAELSKSGQVVQCVYSKGEIYLLFQTDLVIAMRRSCTHDADIHVAMACKSTRIHGVGIQLNQLDLRIRATNTK